VILEPQNRLEQLRLLADSPPVRGRPSIFDLMAAAYGTDQLPGRILRAIRTKSGIQEITIAECIENERQIRYRGNLYVPDGNEVRLHIIQKHHHTGLAGHPG